MIQMRVSIFLWVRDWLLMALWLGIPFWLGIAWVIWVGGFGAYFSCVH